MGVDIGGLIASMVGGGANALAEQSRQGLAAQNEIDVAKEKADIMEQKELRIAAVNHGYQKELKADEYAQRDKEQVANIGAQVGLHGMDNAARSDESDKRIAAEKEIHALDRKSHEAIANKGAALLRIQEQLAQDGLINSREQKGYMDGLRQSIADGNTEGIKKYTDLINAGDTKEKSSYVAGANKLNDEIRRKMLDDPEYKKSTEYMQDVSIRNQLYKKAGLSIDDSGKSNELDALAASIKDNSAKQSVSPEQKIAAINSARDARIKELKEIIAAPDYDISKGLIGNPGNARTLERKTNAKKELDRLLNGNGVGD